MHLELKNDCFELNLQFKDNCGEASLNPQSFKAENNDNPYDELGAAHNKGLEYIARKFGDYIVIEDEIMMKLGVFEDNVILRASTEYLQSYPFKNSAISDHLKEKSALYIKEIGQWDPRPGEIPFNTSFPLDTLVATHDWLERLTYAGVPADMFNFALGALERGQSSIREFIDRIKQVEAKAAKSELSEDDKLRVFALGSVARHSAAYWGAQSSAAKASGPIKSDMKGAASGMAAGFITGVGILVGGVLGGLTRSATYLLAKKAVKG